MKKLVSLALALVLCLSVVSFSAFAEEDTIKITMMVDTTVLDQNNGRDAIEARWEELASAKAGKKVDLEIIQPDHSAYYDVMQQRMSNKEDWPDLVLLSSTYYADYAANGVLWDMTEAWEKSETLNSGRFTGQNVFEGLKIDGKLYGFAPTRGNGCVTYIKKEWLDACGLEAPTTYDEYYAMLKAFAEKFNTTPIAHAGFIGGEAPFVNYLPEFYQDAYPYFVQLEDGTWVDGFAQDNMKAALQRLQDAVKDGLIDKTTLTNTTADARNKFYDGTTGVFTYWAGTWATNLKTNLEANGKDGELVALKPLEGLPPYYDRVPPMWCITTACKDPQLVFDLFIDTMLDGGDMQMLWTYGAEGVHWSKSAGTVLAGTDKEVTYEDGQFHMLENLEKAGTLYTKNHIDPMLSLASFAEGYYDPKADSVKPEAMASAQLFNENSRLASIVPATSELSELNGDLTQIKAQIVADIALGNLSVEDGYKQFEAEGKELSDIIVESLNALN
ncbi:MAG: extracellular solute-binding protein [Clostridia bacterium]|nr:extracellular solute-binding protein [Clostridia bacterium]